MEPNFYKIAIELSEWGFAVFPLSPGSKIPFKGTSGVMEATRDPSRIAEWAKRSASANVGIHCGGPSGVVVLDIDPRNGGIRSRDRLEGMGLALTHTCTARSGNGGLHLFYRLPMTISVKNSAGRLCDGWDFKTTGGYVVGAGSVIGPSKDGPGGAYRWLVPPWLMGPQPLPNWLYSAMWRAELEAGRDDMRAFDENPERWFSEVRSAATKGRSSSEPVGNMNSFEGLVKAVLNAPKGARNNTLNWSAFHCVKLITNGVISASEAASRLEAAALEIGLGKEDGVKSVRATIRSGMTKGGLVQKV